MSEANKNRKLTEETRQKMSEAQKGRKLSEETKRKMSDRFAKKIKNISETQILWSVFPRIDGHKWVITSAKDVQFIGPETYMFGADENGNIISWDELHGSYRGGLEHRICFQNIGYNIDE